MKQSTPSRIQPIHAGVYLASVATAVTIMAYVTDDTVAEISTGGYFDNSDKLLPDVTVVQILSIPSVSKAESFTAMLTRTAKKPTPKSPRDFTYKLTQIVGAVVKTAGGDLTAQGAKIAALEAKNADPKQAIAKDPKNGRHRR